MYKTTYRVQCACDSRDTLRYIYTTYVGIITNTVIGVFFFIFLLFKREPGVIDFHEPGPVAAVTPVGTTARHRVKLDTATTVDNDLAGRCRDLLEIQIKVVVCMRRTDSAVDGPYVSPGLCGEIRAHKKIGRYLSL